MHLLMVIALAAMQSPRLGVDTTDAVNRFGEVSRAAGTMIRSLERAGNVFVLTQTFISARPGAGVGYDTIAFDAGSWRPLWHRVHGVGDSAAVEYRQNRVVGYSNYANRPKRNIDRILPAGAVPDDARTLESTDWSRGPRTLRLYDMWEDSVTTVVYRPLRRDTIPYRGVRSEVWVVQEDRGPGDVLRGSAFVRLLWIDSKRRKVLRRQDRPAQAGEHDGYIMDAR
jgi:hypothetical protein